MSLPAGFIRGRSLLNIPDPDADPAIVMLCKAIKQLIPFTMIFPVSFIETQSSVQKYQKNISANMCSAKYPGTLLPRVFSKGKLNFSTRNVCDELA